MKFDLTIHDVETYAAEPLMHLATLLSVRGVDYDDLLEGATEAVRFVVETYWDELVGVLDGAVGDDWAHFRGVCEAADALRRAMLEAVGA
jgi:hypothetical protein